MDGRMNEGVIVIAVNLATAQVGATSSRLIAIHASGACRMREGDRCTTARVRKNHACRQLWTITLATHFAAALTVQRQESPCKRAGYFLVANVLSVSNAQS